MKRIIKQHTTLVFYLIAVMLTPAAACYAADITLIPSISLREEFDDNVYYTRGSKIEDMFTQVSPAFTLDYATELLDIKSRAVMDILRYADEDNLDTEFYDINTDGAYNILERYTLTGNFSYIKDTTLESELVETGLADARQDRTRYIGGMGLSYNLDEISQIGMNYNHNKTSYELPEYSDYDVDYVGLYYSVPLNNQVDLFSIQSYYQKYKTKTSSRTTIVPYYMFLITARLSYYSKTDNYGLTFRWMHVFSETLTLSSTLGTRYTETDYSQAWNTPSGPQKTIQKNNSWAGIADIKLEKTGETYTASAGYNRDLSYSSTGTPINRDRLSFNATKRITERYTISFFGNLYYTKSDDKITEKDVRHYNFSPSISYNITKDHSLSIRYFYANSYDKTLSTDTKYDRNRIWISLNFRFPRKW